jgi:hypothetical protein
MFRFDPVLYSPRSVLYSYSLPFSILPRFPILPVLECSNGQQPGKGSSWLRLRLPSRYWPLVLRAA